MQRGASGYQYGDLSAGVNRPLGFTLDAPYNSSDPFQVWILGAHAGLALGVGVAAAAITIDHLVVSAAGGRIQDITTLGNGTYSGRWQGGGDDRGGAGTVSGGARSRIGSELDL